MIEPMSPENRSSCIHPDLDWSQVRETVLMLTLAVAQIESAMGEGDNSVQTLTDSFIGMVEHINNIEKTLAKFPDGPIKETILKNSVATSDKIQASIVAFQFYDKLQQRLQHTAYSLTGLSDLVSDPSRLYNPFEWKKLQDYIRSKYTLPADKAMFDAILHGKTIEEAMNASREDHGDNEIEFF